MNALEIPKTIQDYCDARSRALLMLDDGIKQFEAATATLKTIGSYAAPIEIAYIGNARPKMVKDIDRALWTQSFTVSGYMSLLDAKAYDEFDKQVQNDPPEFTIENVRSTFIDLMQNADMMFARGVVTVFSRLSDKYKTNSNEPFSMTPKAVMTWMFEHNYYGGIRVRYGTYASGQINDLDRVFRVLDGKPHNERTLETAINAAFQKGCTVPYEDEYFKLRGYKNGNCHILFKRADLLEKVNAIIGKFYGDNALGERKL